MLLGLDYGKRRIGIAKSDEQNSFAHGTGFIARTPGQLEKDVEKLAKIIKADRIVKVIVGHPLNMDGTRGAQALEAERFADLIRRQTGLDVILWDERLSSREAERYLLAGDVSRLRRRKKIDQLSAQIILQSYMDTQVS